MTKIDKSSKLRSMKHKDIINKWASRSELAKDLDVKGSRVDKWYLRNSIPSEFWNDIILSAKKRNIAINHMDIIKAVKGKAA